MLVHVISELPSPPRLHCQDGREERGNQESADQMRHIYSNVLTVSVLGCILKITLTRGIETPYSLGKALKTH